MVHADIKSTLPRRLRGSDSISYSCNCSETGLVILFYGYFHLDGAQGFADQEKYFLIQLGLTGKVRISEEGANVTVAGDKEAIEEYVSAWCHRFSNNEDAAESKKKLKEFSSSENSKTNGFNLFAPSISSLTKDLLPENSSLHELDRLWLENDETKKNMQSFLISPFWTPFKKLFFKPTPGCKHVFDDLSVKLVQEICPLGVDQANWKPKLSWDNIEKAQPKIDCSKLENDLPRIKLSPKDFHSLLKGSANSEVSSGDRLQSSAQDTDIVLLDVRNYYESELGNFEGAVCPPIRNFKSLPIYLRKNLPLFSKKTLVTYCTGGIRCEKATAYIRDFIQPELQSKSGLEPINAVYMLEGGIHNYLEWFQTSKSPEEECLFQGRNYIFDARQSTSLSDYSIHSTSTNEKQASKRCITKCGFCSAPAAHLYKCTSQHCHKLIVRCAPLNMQNTPAKPSNCYLSLPSCCLDCLNSVKTKAKKVGLCECELKRVQALETVQVAS